MHLIGALGRVSRGKIRPRLCCNQCGRGLVTARMGGGSVGAEFLCFTGMERASASYSHTRHLENASLTAQ